MFPYISEESEFFSYAAGKGYLVREPGGGPAKFYATATSSSKVGCFDFTNPDFLAWYEPRVRRVLELGVGVVKTDFSEAVPEDAVYYDGSSGVQGHNKLTFLYARTIYEIMRSVAAQRGERPMLWGRSGYAGSHTIPAAWAGDSSTHQNNHACVLRGGLSIACSGIPFWGFDMGGFYNTDHEGYECPPTEEEYIRSVQFGMLSPLARCHGKTPREPWQFGKRAEDIFRSFNDLRHRMQPYLYSTALAGVRDRMPMLRPMILEYPGDRAARHAELQYMLGNALLVAPVFDQEQMEVYFPEGRWTEWFGGEIIEGGGWKRVPQRLDRIPIYQRENTAIPMLCEAPEDAGEAFGSMRLLLALNGEMCGEILDDGAARRVEARYDGGCVYVDTDFPACEILLSVKEEVCRAVLCKKDAALERVGNRYRIAPAGGEEKKG